MRAERRPRALAALCACLAASLWGRASQADVVHVYTRGETLAQLSERYYGTVAHEAVLVAANFLQVQQSPTIQTGVHLVIPSVSYHRVVLGETWERLAQHLMGNPRHGAWLATHNGGQFGLSPSAGTVIRVPYLLRYVITNDEPLFEIARRYYGDRSLVQFILEFNGLSSQRLSRGQVLVLPLIDLTLRDTAADSPDAPLVAAHEAQLSVERELPRLTQLLNRGLYVETVALGARLAAVSDLSLSQRVQIHRQLAEAYVALDREDLAAQLLRDTLQADPSFTLDATATPPKLLHALDVARGGGSTQTTAAPPPTSRPEGAH